MLFFMFFLQDTETESYVNNAEPWKQGVGGLVAPRTFAARFFVTRCPCMFFIRTSASNQDGCLPCAHRVCSGCYLCLPPILNAS